MTEPFTEKVRKAIYVKVDKVVEEFYHFEGSRESIFLGEWDVKVGDKVKITFEKVEG